MTRSSHGLDTDPRRGWWEHAKCAEIGLAVFFPDGGRNSTLVARRICDQCTVRQDCLAFVMRIESGLSADCRAGIWAGLDGQERWKLQRCHTGVCEHGEHRVVDDAGR